jgi:DNA-binding CsgD family transcriptional regulator
MRDFVAPSGGSAIEIARSRRDPIFVIVDGDAELVAAPVPGSGAARALPYSLGLKENVRRLIGDAAGASALAVLDDSTIVRVVPLEGGPHAQFAVFVEPHEPRDLLRTAAHRYALTAREIEVTRLLLRGDSTRDISESLFISELTVHQHVKNIGRKMGVSKRMEIVGRILDGRGTNAAALSP